MSHSVQNNNSQTGFNLNAPESLAFGTLVSSGLGAASAALFTSFSPLGGAVYGASYFLSGRVIDTICEKLSANAQHPAAKVARFAISTIGGIAAGAGNHFTSRILNVNCDWCCHHNWIPRHPSLGSRRNHCRRPSDRRYSKHYRHDHYRRYRCSYCCTRRFKQKICIDSATSLTKSCSIEGMTIPSNLPFSQNLYRFHWKVRLLPTPKAADSHPTPLKVTIEN